MNLILDIPPPPAVADDEAGNLPWEIERRLARLNERYVQCLDAKRLDDWPRFFAEDGVYRIYPRENLEAGLPASLLYLDGHRMMRDRVLCLKEVILYSDRAVRHFLGAPIMRQIGPDAFGLTTNLLVIHSDSEGHSSIFCAGEYRDRVVEREGRLLFLEKTVVVDTFTVPSHLSHPV